MVYFSSDVESYGLYFIAYGDERNGVFSGGFETIRIRSLCIMHWINRKGVYKRAQPSPFNDAQNYHTP